MAAGLPNPGQVGAASSAAVSAASVMAAAAAAQQAAVQHFKTSDIPLPLKRTLAQRVSVCPIATRNFHCQKQYIFKHNRTFLIL